jgi:hypothetical protein
MGFTNNTRSEEICRLKFVTGITDKPNLKLYWTEDPVFETPIF